MNMDILKFCLCGMLLLFPVIGCTEQAENSTMQKTSASSKQEMASVGRKTTILQSGDVLVLSENINGKPSASYISTRPANKEIVANRIIQILEGTRANKSFLEFAKSGLPENRVLKKANFTLPLTDQDFSREVKSRIFLSQALSGAPTCTICRGYLHVNSITTDHIERKREGGTGSPENGQLAHPYCNSTYKH